MVCVQVIRLNVDPGDHKAVTQKLRSLPNVTHVLFLGRASGSMADRDLAADLEGFRSLVAAARAAGCALQITQFTSADDLTKGATLCPSSCRGPAPCTLQFSRCSSLHRMKGCQEACPDAS